MGNIGNMHIHSYSTLITITNIRICMHIYGTYTISYASNRLMLIRISHRTLTGTYSNFMLIQISRRRYRAYPYSEVPVGTTDQNDTHLFTLIPSYGYYHITMGILRPVLINE